MRHALYGVTLAAWLGLPLVGCGDSDDRDRDPERDASQDPIGEPTSDAAVDERDGGTLIDADLGRDAEVVEQLPTLFPVDSPIIYLNDHVSDVYVDAYIYAIASNREVPLRGVITSWDTTGERQRWIDAARAAGFQLVPDNVEGAQGVALVKPASGALRDTARLGSPGADLIVREAAKVDAAHPLVLIVGGPLTTIADAYLADPSIVGRTFIAWVGGAPNGSLDEPNARMDPWATEIVLRSFKTLLLPTGVASPHTPVARMLSEFPPSALRDYLVSAGRYSPDFDADGAAAVAIRSTAFVTAYDRYTYGATGLVRDDQGSVHIVTKGDSEAGGQEFFRALNRAFREGAGQTTRDGGL